MKAQKNFSKKTIVAILVCLALVLALGLVLIKTIGNNTSNVSTDRKELNVKNGYQVESLYCNLYFPNKWKDYTLIEEELNVVEVSADLGNGKKQHIYDIVFVDKDIETIDEMEKDERMLEAWIVSFEPEYTKEWTEEDKKIVENIQKDKDYVIKKLEKVGVEVQE